MGGWENSFDFYEFQGLFLIFSQESNLFLLGRQYLRFKIALSVRFWRPKVMDTHAKISICPLSAILSKLATGAPYERQYLNGNMEREREREREWERTELAAALDPRERSLQMHGYL